MTGDETGVVVPAAPSGRRSSADLGRAVIADALRGVDPVGALGAERESSWHSEYLVHFRRVLVAGLASGHAAVTVADDGLQSVQRRMKYRGTDGAERALDAMFDGSGASQSTVEVHGRGKPEADFSLPFRGARLSGDALSRRLESWTEAGVLEPSAADRVRTVMAHPEWLRLDGQTVVVLGAGAEMGPLPALLRWGARVAAIDLPSPEVWRRVLSMARDRAGTLLVPIAKDGVGGADPVAAVAHAGLDLLTGAGAAAQWIRELDGRVVLGNYVYADGVTNLRLSASVDAITCHLQTVRPDLALAFLATPTDVFAVPADALAHALRAYDNRSTLARILGRPLQIVSAGRLLRRQYLPGVHPAIHDALVPQQGPNYALAKRLQRWRATVARHAGSTVSMNVAPPTRTRSVLKNRALAAAYAGAHFFAIEVFEPATANTLMAALLVADLNTGGGPVHEQPWQDEAYSAVHGGLWRAPYQPRSVLGLAAVLGFGAARA